jgi:hypothetical protein
VHHPTFWAASSFVHVRDREDGAGFAVLVGGPGAVSVDARGRCEWIVVRNAPRELSFGFLPVLAHPVRAANDESHGTTAAVRMTAAGDWRDLALHEAAGAALAESGCAPSVLREAARGLVVPGPGVRVRAVKRAEDGRGTIVRVAVDRRPASVRVDAAVRQVVRCDALERDVAELAVRDGVVRLPDDCGLVTLRLVPPPDSLPDPGNHAVPCVSACGDARRSPS